MRIPTWSREIAVATALIIGKLTKQTSGFGQLSGGEGTYHMTAGVQTSLYDFARMILEKADCISRRARWFAAPTDNRSLLTKPVVSIVTAERPAHARRPAYSVLSNFPLARVFGFH
jgi:dTDP-4-dehydrorhamnose reductase